MTKINQNVLADINTQKRFQVNVFSTLASLVMHIDRRFSLSRNKKNKSKTIQWIKSRNCDPIENK